MTSTPTQSPDSHKGILDQLIDRSVLYTRLRERESQMTSAVADDVGDVRGKRSKVQRGEVGNREIAKPEIGVT